MPDFRVTLIRPPVVCTGLMSLQRIPHLGLAYIAAAAKKAGYAVDVIDMCGEDIDHFEVLRGKFVAYGLPLSELNKRLQPSKVIGITCNFSQDWVFTRELIQYVRQLLPESVIVAGGEHISAIPDYCLTDCPELDACVLGEGEGIFTDLLSAIKENRDWSQVEGLVYSSPLSDREKGREIKRTNRAKRFRDIDELPPPAWDLFPMENYLSRGMNYHVGRGRTIPMIASRGCPFECTFCSSPQMWGTLWKAYDPGKVVDLMEEYVRDYSAENFIFSDLTTIIKKSTIVALCKEILNRKLNITWQVPTTRTEALDRETIALLYESGCRDMDFAIESGSIVVLTAVKKRNKPTKMTDLIRHCVSAGMSVTVNIILGLPQETWKDFFKSYFLVMKLAIIGLHEVNVNPFVPYPGSALFKEFLSKDKLQLNDKFFLDLYHYSDVSKAFSWSDQYSAKQLRAMRIIFIGSFYGLMFLSHPLRISQLVSNMIHNRSTTKFEVIFKRMFVNLKNYIGWYVKNNLFKRTKPIPT